jgi:Xaa-Pro aminopeptidase
VQPASALPGGDDRTQYCFETLTFAPVDRRLVHVADLSPGERGWLNAYHAETLAKLSPRVSAAARTWLEAATAPL